MTTKTLAPEHATLIDQQMTAPRGALQEYGQTVDVIVVYKYDVPTTQPAPRTFRVTLHYDNSNPSFGKVEVWDAGKWVEVYRLIDSELAAHPPYTSNKTDFAERRDVGADIDRLHGAAVAVVFGG